MRTFRINYDSMEGIWLVYLGVCFWGASLLYLIFFLGKWPFPPMVYAAFALSILVGSMLVLVGYKNRGGEVQVRVTYLTFGIISYLIWYVLFIKLVIYDSIGIAHLVPLTALLAVSLIFFAYSLIVKDELTFKIRR